jgi:hypothetical protein
VVILRRNNVIGISVSACVFAAVNYVHLRRPVTCYDCFFPYGFPFTFFREGGFGGGGGIVWGGMAGDLLIVLGVGMATAYLLGLLKRRA